MSKPLRVLIIEDSEDDAELLLRALSSCGYDPISERVETRESMSDALQKQTWEIIIADYSMPHFNGLEALKLLRQNDLDIPCIIVSGKIGEDTAMELMKAGANDYIIKGNLKRLVPAIERELRDAEARRVHKQAEKRLRESEERLKESQVLGRIGSWEFDVEKQTINWSEETYVLYERDPKFGPPSIEEEACYYSPQQAKVLRDYAASIIENGQECSYDLEVILPSGKTAYYHARVCPIKDTQDRVVKLSGIVQDITERRRIEQQLITVNRLYRLLSDINQAIVRTKDREELLQAICRIAVDVGEFRMAWIGMLDNESNEILPVTHYGYDNGYLEIVTKVMKNETSKGRLMSLAYRKGEVVINNDIEENLKTWPWLIEAMNRGYRSLATIPIKSKDRVIGNFSVYSDVTGFFTKEMENLLTEISTDISFALEAIDTEQKRKQLEDELININRMYALLSDINQAIVRIQNRDELLQSICKIAVETGKFRMAWIGMLDESNEVLPIVHCGYEEGYLEIVHAIMKNNSYQGNPIAVAVGGGQVVINNNIEEGYKTRPWLVEATKRGYRSLAAIPIKAKDKVIGNFSVYSDITGFFNQDMEKLLIEIGSDISYGLESIETEQKRKKLEEELEAANRLYALLSDINEAVVRIKDRDELFRTICQVAINTGKFRMAWIGLIDKESEVLQPVAVYGAEEVPMKFNPNFTWKDPPDDRPISRAMHNGKVVISNDMEIEMKESPRYSEAIKHGYRAMALIPLTIQDKVVGNFTIFADKPGFFTTEERKLLEEIGADISFSLESIEIEKERQRVAEALKKSEEKHRIVADNTYDWEFWVNPEGVFIYNSPSCKRVTGYNAAEFISDSKLLFRIIDPNDQQIWLEHVGSLTDSGDTIVFRIINKDGDTHWIEHICLSVYNEQGKYLGKRGSNRDITERKKSEIIMQARLNLLQFATSHTLDELLQATLDEAETLTGSQIGFYHFIEADQKTLSLQQWSTRTLREACTAQGKGLHYAVEQAGVWVDCIHERRPVIHNDYFALPHRKGLPSGHANVSRELVVPVFRGDQIVALLGVGNKPQYYTASDVDIVSRLADLAWDIAERMRAEEVLFNERNNFQSILASSPVAMLVIHNDARIIFANATAEQLFGRKLADFKLARYGDFVSCTNRNKDPRGCGYSPNCLTCPFFSAISSALTNGTKTTGLEGEALLQREQNLKPIWIKFQVKSLELDGNKCAVISVDNITEHKQAEEALKDSEEKYRLVVDNATDAIFVAQDGMLLFPNRRTMEIIGYSEEELVSKPFIDFIHPEDRQMVISRHLQRLKGEEPPSIYSFRIISKSKGIKWVELHAVAITWEGKAATLNLLRDITENKQAEEQRRQLEQKAQIASRLASVGEMAAGIAHEINNPLTAVIGYAELLMDRKDIPVDIRRELTTISNGAQRVTGIVKRLLTFSRQTNLERKLVNINELIESTLVLRAYHLRVNTIKVIARLAPDLPGTVADPGQLQQVFLNLIVNAETEMKLAHGKGKLIITTKKIKNTIKISVKDDGPGIRPEIIDKLFDPFFTTREVGQGTGLGLSLCYGIITEHNGRIYVESDPGKGATFIVELPVVSESELLKPAEPVLEQAEKVVKARILVVDDELAIRNLVKRVLVGEGHEVDTADNANDALKKVESQRYNLILLDIKMPGMDGVELYQRIQKIAESLAQRVVFITGDIMGADTDKFLTGEKIAHIDKPFTAAQLKQEISRALMRGL